MRSFSSMTSPSFALVVQWAKWSGVISLERRRYVMCECGHAKSQHHNGKCDYEGYSCSCTGYKPQKKERRMDEICQVCGEVGADRRTLLMRYFYEIDEVSSKFKRRV